MTANPQAGGGLLPCPFCQTGKPHVVNPASGAPPYVLCECGGAGAQRSTEAECIAAWNRRASTSGLAGEAVAKPLVWDPYRAETPFGYYHIDDQTDRSDDELKGRPAFLLSGSRIDLSRHSTLEEARAAAQADFETRIRSALAVPPSIPAGGVREGWKLVPSEATPEMLGAWYRYKNGHRWPDEEPARDTSDVGAYRAMLAAAPAPATLSLPAGGVREADDLRLNTLSGAVEHCARIAEAIDSGRGNEKQIAAGIRSFGAALSLPAGGVAVSDAELLDAMAKNIRLELSWGEVSDFEGEPCQWRVHERTGNRNDREWALVGFGATPAEAIRRARASVKGAGQS